MYLYFLEGWGIQFYYMNKIFEESLSSSGSCTLGAQGQLNLHLERRGVCLGHNKGSA